ncbi:MAG: 2-hydroxyacyl-CoA dehydratase [Longimicrobiales bacterium]|nr:2-hydroxyacyl-CoA dehydratase [Longimicrobiales bacterium]
MPTPPAPSSALEDDFDPLLELNFDAGLEPLMLELREVVQDPDLPTVQRWRDRGGRVLAHFQVYFPEELAHAAGMLPVKVRGSRIERREADSLFGSALCSILRSSLELALTDRLVPDLFVTHPICDAARNLAGIWSRNLEAPAEILFFPQNPNSRHSHTWLTGEYRRILGHIEEVAGRRVDDDALRHSIHLFNENRRLLREVYAIKRETPWLLPVDDAYVLVATAGLLPREEHNALLRRLLPLIRRRERKPKDRMRVVFEGGFCEQPPLDLLAAIAEFVDVVDDDLLIGLRWILEDVDPGSDPVAGLAEAYLERSSYSPVQHDLRKPKEEMLLARIEASRAEAAIVAAAKMCEPGLDEQVAYAQALDRAGIPYFLSEFEEEMQGYDHLQVQLETFVENILFQ